MERGYVVRIARRDSRMPMSSASPGDERLASASILGRSTSCFDAMRHRLKRTLTVFARRLNDDAE